MIEERFRIQILPIWHDGPDGDKAGFIWAIRAALNRILLSHAGRVHPDSLRFQMKTILFMPYEGNDRNAEEDSATPGFATIGGALHADDRDKVLFGWQGRDLGS